MRLGLKIPWFSRTDRLERDLDREFSNIRDWWNAHDEGFRQWTNFSVAGGTSFNPATVTTSTTLSQANNFVLADATGGVVTITLPSAAGARGRVYVIKRMNAGKNLVKIALTGSETLDGGTGYSLGWQYHVVTVFSDGTNWLIWF